MEWKVIIGASPSPRLPVKFCSPRIRGDDEVLPPCPLGVVMSSPYPTTTLSWGRIGHGVVEIQVGGGGVVGKITQVPLGRSWAGSSLT